MYYDIFKTNFLLFLCRVPISIAISLICAIIWILILGLPASTPNSKFKLAAGLRDPSADYALAVGLYAFAAVFELLAEPFRLIAQIFLMIRFKVHLSNSISKVTFRNLILSF